MFDVILTIVSLETHGSPGPYPVTQVYRLEFDTKEAFESWLRQGLESGGVASAERMLGQALSPGEPLA